MGCEENTAHGQFRDDEPEGPDHADAWNVAHHKRAESNLARAYIELRQLAKYMWEGPIDDAEQERLNIIIHANDL